MMAKTSPAREKDRMRETETRAFAVDDSECKNTLISKQKPEEEENEATADLQDRRFLFPRSISLSLVDSGLWAEA